MASESYEVQAKASNVDSSCKREKARERELEKARERELEIAIGS